MLDISFVELFLVAIVGLMVIGPKQLPDALRTLGLWLGRMRRSFNAVKSEIEREIGMDDIRRQLHNEAVLDEMKRIEENMRGAGDDIKNTIHSGVTGDDVTPADETALETPAGNMPTSSTSTTLPNEPSSSESTADSRSDSANKEEPNQRSGNA